MAVSLHSREEALELIRSISAEQWREGIVIFNPKREASVRKEKGKRVNFQVWPDSIATRFLNAILHLRKKFGGEIGLEVACRRLETAHSDEKELEEA